MSFNDREYTKDAIIKQASLIELHSKDGSAVDAGCECIEGKHLINIEGLAEEGVGFALSEKEKRFYEKLGDFARNLRKTMEDESFEFPSNPVGRHYLPYGLTECEKGHPSVVKKLSRCIKKVEKREGCRPPYIDCPVNPVAVCRASIKCPP